MVSARQIESEFFNLIGVTTWKWKARQVADDRFLLRFPTANMAAQWCNLKNLTMKNEAQIKIEPWVPVFGVKGMLQSAWFRVSNIPADQRSLMNLARVGGLVGKVIAYDEGTRYRYDYVRLHIACRNVSKVPKTAEASLAMQLIDFGFERELDEGEGSKILKSEIKVGDDQQPPPKKYRTYIPPTGNSGNQKVGGHRLNVSQPSGKQSQDQVWSAPPKIKFKSRSQVKMMGDAQKAYKNDEAMRSANVDDGKDHGEKVFIPKTFDDLDTGSDSDSFTERIVQLTGMDPGQSSKGDGFESHNQAWHISDIVPTDGQALEIMIKNHSKVQESTLTSVSIEGGKKEASTKQAKTFLRNTSSTEVYITEDNIANTQDSVENILEDIQAVDNAVTLKEQNLMSLDSIVPIIPDNNMGINQENQENALSKIDDIDEHTPVSCDSVVSAQHLIPNIILGEKQMDGEKKEAQSNVTQMRDDPDDHARLVEPRRSERLIETTNVHTMDKVEKVAKKRLLEGLSSDEEKDAIKQGVDTMMQITLKLLSKKAKKKTTICYLEALLIIMSIDVGVFCCVLSDSFI